MPVKPSLRRERQLLRDGCTFVAGIDEVGRGAIAGPVSVGVALVTESTRSAPAGLRDSKLLTPALRKRLAPRLRRWAVAHAVGHAGPDEIDEWGIIAALRLAALRALAQVPTPDVIILDGTHDYISRPAATLFDVVPWPEIEIPPVRLIVKADRVCTSVAAASVIAKVERDAMLVDLHQVDGRFGWHENKGYTTPEHADGIRSHGLSEHHRRSWDIAAAMAEADQQRLVDLSEPGATEPVHSPPGPSLIPS